MPGYYRIIPEYIATANFLSAEEKIFYSLLCSLISKYGFCWASNKYLAQASGAHPRTIPKWLKKFVKYNLIVVELECFNERKIWLPETWGNRENLLKAYGKENIERQNELNQRFYTHAPKGTPPMPLTASYIEDTNKKDIKHIEAWPKRLPRKASPPANPSSPSFQSGIKTLPPMMKGPPPTPGPKKIVQETLYALSTPHKIGSQEVFLAKSDWEYFLGFSSYTVNEAFERAHRESKQGKRISNLPAWLFSMCARITKENQ
jgi:hypothetical protein